MSFAKHSAQMLVWRAASVLIATVTVILLARWLGPVDRGELAIFILSLSLAALTIQFGLPEAIVYVIGSKRYTSEEVVSTILMYLAFASLLLALPGYWLLVEWGGIEASVSALLVGTVVLIVLLAIVRHVLLAHKNFGRYSLSVVAELSVYLAVLIAFKAIGALTVKTALLAYAVSQLSALTPLLVMQRASTNALITPSSFRPAIIAHCYRYASHLFFVGIGTFGARRINFFLLEFFLGLRAVGLFAAANSIPSIFANLPQQLSTVLYAHVANASGQDYGVRLTVLVFKILTVFCVLAIIPIAVFVDPVVRLLFGPEFDSIGNTMVVLTVGMAITGLASLLFNSLAGSGYPKYGSYMTFISLGMVSVLAYLWIPMAGIEGAAWAHLTTASANLIFIAAVFCRKFNVAPALFWSFSETELALLRSTILNWR